MSEQDPADLVAAIAEGYVNSRCLHVIAVSVSVMSRGRSTPRDRPRSRGRSRRRGAWQGHAPPRLVRGLRDDGRGIPAQRGVRAAHVRPSQRAIAADPYARTADHVGLVQGARGLGQIGSTGGRAHDPDGFFAYLDSHPGESKTYDEGMTAMTLRRIERIVPHYDFSSVRQHRRHRRWPRTSAPSGPRPGTEREGDPVRPATGARHLRRRRPHLAAARETSSATRCQRPTATCCPTSSMTGAMLTRSRSSPPCALPRPLTALCCSSSSSSRRMRNPSWPATSTSTCSRWWAAVSARWRSTSNCSRPAVGRLVATYRRPARPSSRPGPAKDRSRRCCDAHADRSVPVPITRSVAAQPNGTGILVRMGPNGWMPLGLTADSGDDGTFLAPHDD